MHLQFTIYHLSLISHLSFTKQTATDICKLLNDKSLRIEKCELIIAPTQGGAV